MSKLKNLTACALGIIFACSTPAALSQWVEQGPGPTLNGQVEGLPGKPVSGPVNAIAVDRAHPGTIYLGTVNGGVWKSTNANTSSPTWKPLTDLQLPALSINSIAISPLNSSVIFAGTGTTSSFSNPEGSRGFGVIRSTDAGATWSILAGPTLGVGANINSIVPLAHTTGGLSGQVVLAATLFEPMGVHRSTNGGASFTRISGSNGLPSVGVSSLVADPTNSSRVYAAVPFADLFSGPVAGVFRSDDAGVSWTPVNTGLTGLDTSRRILLTVGRKTGVVYAMVIAAGGGINSFVATGVFRSANGGATWTALGVPSPTIHPGGQGLVNGAIVADPVNPNVVYVGGDRQDSPFPNANGCNNFSANTFRGDASLTSPWQSVVCNGAQGTSPHAGARDMDFDNYENLLQANDGGFNRLNNPNVTARQWVSLDGNLRPAQMHSAAFDAVTKTAFGGTEGTGTTMQNAPGSRFWTDFLQGDGGVVAVDDTSAGGSSSIRYTSFPFLRFFNRSTWSPSNTLISGPTPLGLQITSGPGTGLNLFEFDPNIHLYTPYELNRIDPNRMLIATLNIYESRDRGDTLANLFFTASDRISSLSYGGRLKGLPMPDAFYAGTTGAFGPALLHRATKGGRIIALTAYPGGGVRDLVMDPQDIRRVYVVDEQNRVWASFDAGATWRNLTANLPKLLAQENVPGTSSARLARTVELFRPAINGRTVLLVGGLGGVFEMCEPGATGAMWKRLGSNLPHGLVLDLRYNYKSNVLIAGVFGRGAWTLTNFFTGGSHSTWESAAAATANESGTTATPLALPAGVPTVAPQSGASGARAVVPTGQ
ncbi:MAG: repeat domain protein [Massilia sp.]|nr:repeat domain protein [Massilia sp.]